MGTVYQLTQLTGRGRNADRRIVILRQEVRRAPFFAGLAGVLLTLPLVAALVPAIGAGVLVLPVLAAVALAFVFTGRQRRHMQLTHFQAYRNTLRARGKLGGKERDLRGIFLINGQEFQRPTFVLSTQPLVWDGTEDSGIDLFQLDRKRR